MKRQEAINLVARAIRSGVFNDLGSGSNVDVSVITKSGTETLRNYEMPVSFPLNLYAWHTSYMPPRLTSHSCMRQS